MNKMKKGLRIVCFFLFAFTVAGFPAAAQEYPIKPVTLINPMGAGGSHDLTARAVTSVASTYLGQPVIIQIKQGGGGAIGTEIVAKAAPDGYTLLFGGPGWNSILPAVEGRSKGPDAFEPVCRINYSPTLIFTKPDAPYKTFKEMLAWAKAHPGELVFGNTGPWGAVDTPWKMIMKEAGITCKIVPHDGGGPAMIALLGGHLDVSGAFTAPALPHIKSGKLRPLVILDEKRDPALPDVPTAKEEGVNVVFLMWRGVLAPKGTPRPIIDKIAAAFEKMTQDKSVVSMIDRFGDEIQFLGPDAFGKLWREEYDKYRELAKTFKK